MIEERDLRLSWELKFLAALTASKNVSAAARAAGITSSTAYWNRNRNAAFAAEWLAALAAPSDQAGVEPARTTHNHWRKAFLDALAETSNVSAAAAQVNVPTRTVYKLRREDADFATRWLAALHEGYDNLEMELVGYLRDPAPARKMDVTAALRLLAAHRETVERHRALAAEEDEQQVLDSIDAFLEGMRQRRIAHEQLTREAADADDAE